MIKARQALYHAWFGTARGRSLEKEEPEKVELIGEEEAEMEELVGEEESEK